jgi:hypothetical protein
MAAAVIGKVIRYFLIELVDKGIKYFSKDKNTETIVKNILEDLSDNKSFIDDVTDIVSNEKNINNTVANRIVKMSIVQSTIKKYTKGNNDIDNTEIENGLSTIFFKSWNDNSITNKAVQNVKKEIK